ncbi:Solute carrier organic anion transporter family member 1A4 [Nymphon striatum]|nr:Solute carrier organic anion transporter family member 1A4 [Nymphon striatum]
MISKKIQKIRNCYLIYVLWILFQFQWSFHLFYKFISPPFLFYPTCTFNSQFHLCCTDDGFYQAATFFSVSNLLNVLSLSLLWKKTRHNKLCFLIVHCLAGLHIMSLWGYLPSIMTNLEKLLGFSTQIVSLIFVFGEISTFLFSIVLSYYGGTKHRPRMLAVALPHAIFGSKEITQNMNGNDLISTSLDSPFKLVCTEARNETCNESIESFETSSVITCFLLCLGIFISNAGAVIWLNIGASYLDDNLATQTTVLFIVDPGFDESDPRWIGAWWIGFVVIGIQCILVGILMGIFPKNLKFVGLKKPDLSNDVMELAKAKGIKEDNLWKGNILFSCKLINSFFINRMICITEIYKTLSGIKITEIMASEPQCIHTCDCNNFQFNPICDVDMGITYFSPCHANCKEHISESGTEGYDPASMSTAALKHESWKSVINCEARLPRTSKEWKNTPRPDGYSPAEILFGRRQQELLPVFSSAYNPVYQQDAKLQRHKNQDAN